MSKPTRRPPKPPRAREREVAARLGAYLEGFLETHDDLPDGAWWAACESSLDSLLHDDKFVVERHAMEIPPGLDAHDLLMAYLENGR